MSRGCNTDHEIMYLPAQVLSVLALDHGIVSR
jgi:hypothetical protein